MFKRNTKFCAVAIVTLISCGRKTSFIGSSPTSSPKENQDQVVRAPIPAAPIPVLVLAKPWSADFKLSDFTEISEKFEVPAAPLQVTAFEQQVEAPKTFSMQLGGYAQQGTLNIERVREWTLGMVIDTTDGGLATQTFDLFVTVSNRPTTTVEAKDKMKRFVKKAIENLYGKAKINVFISGLFVGGVAEKASILASSGLTTAQATNAASTALDTIFNKPVQTNQIFNSQYLHQTFAQSGSHNWGAGRLYLIMSDESNCTIADGSPDASCVGQSTIGSPHQYSKVYSIAGSAEPNAVHAGTFALTAVVYPKTRPVGCTTGNIDAAPTNQLEMQSQYSIQFKRRPSAQFFTGSSTSYSEDLCAITDDFTSINKATTDALELLRLRRADWMDVYVAPTPVNANLNFKIDALNSDGTVNRTLAYGTDYSAPYGIPVGYGYPILNPTLPLGVYRMKYYTKTLINPNSVTYQTYTIPLTTYDLPVKMAPDDTVFELISDTTTFSCPVQGNFANGSVCRIARGVGTTADKLYFKDANFSMLPAKINPAGDAITYRYSKNKVYEKTFFDAKAILNVTRDSNSTMESSTVEKVASGLKVSFPSTAADGMVTISYLENTQVQQDFSLTAVPASNDIKCYLGNLPASSFEIANGMVLANSGATPLTDCKFEVGKIKMTGLLQKTIEGRYFTAAYVANVAPRSAFSLANMPTNGCSVLDENGIAINNFERDGKIIELGSPLTPGHFVTVVYKYLKDESRCVTASSRIPDAIIVTLDGIVLNSTQYSRTDTKICFPADVFKSNASISIVESK